MALCKKKIAEGDGDHSPLLHREAFESNYKNIFGEALAWKIRHDAMRKKGSSLMDGASKMVRGITSLSRKSSTLSCASNSSAGGSSFELTGPPATCSTDDYDYKGRDSKEEGRRRTGASRRSPCASRSVPRAMPRSSTRGTASSARWMTPSGACPPRR